jgi:hypothetical protein
MGVSESWISAGAPNGIRRVTQKIKVAAANDDALLRIDFGPNDVSVLNMLFSI